MTSLSVIARPFRAGRPVVSVRLLLLAAVAVLAGLLSSPAAAESSRGLLVVEGLGGTSSELVLPRRTPLRTISPTFTGGREFAAVLLEPLSGPGRGSLVGAVQVRAFQDSTSALVAPLGADGDLQAGRYRVTLLGQGPVRATYALFDADDPGIVLRPRNRIAQQFFGRSEPLFLGYSSARVDLPGAVPAGRRVIQVGLEAGLSVDDYRMCVTAGPGCSRRLLPLCPPVVPCPTQQEDLPRPGVTTQPSVTATFSAADPEPRSLRWSVEGYRDDRGALRAAAIVF